MRFMVKENSAARALLDAALQRLKRAELSKTLVGYGNAPLGAIMFIDAERGTKLFKEAGFETRELATFMPEVPLSGFFGGAQIGPSSTMMPGDDKGETRSVLHNSSSVIAFIRNRSATTPTCDDEDVSEDEKYSRDGK
jgi:small ligand-binding sensory domain FIST